MGNLFAGSEIVELGIQIEKNGRDFYNAVAGRSKNNKARDIFTYLAAEETKHIAIFKKILDSVNKYEPPEAYPGEYFAYMNALASQQVFTQKDKGAQAAKNVTSDKQAVELAIGFEKDSIIFYEGIRKMVPEYDYKVVDELITQEQNHLKQLSELKNNL